MMCGLANLSEDAIKAVKDLESEMGKRLLAYNCGKVEADTLTEAELNKIQKAEKDMGVVFVAYK